MCHVKGCHGFQGQTVKSQLVADVLNSQHAGTGATWRINMKILLTCRGWRYGGCPASACLITTMTGSGKG